jgi:hypothetical protein
MLQLEVHFVPSKVLQLTGMPPEWANHPKRQKGTIRHMAIIASVVIGSCIGTRRR